MSIGEMVGVLPDGVDGDALLRVGNETIHRSLLDTHVSFAVYLSDDCFPKKTYGYHFVNIEDAQSVFGRNIENELSEIYWYSPKKCIVLNNEVHASKYANLTIISPCIIINNFTVSNIDILKLDNHILQSLFPEAPAFLSTSVSTVLINGMGKDNSLGVKNFVVNNSNLYFCYKNSFETLGIVK